MKPVHTKLALAFSAALFSVSVHAQTTQAAPTDRGATPTTSQAGPATAATGQSAQRGAADTAVEPREADQKSMLVQDDESFLENAIQGSYAEIEGSQLALEKSRNQDVRQFAERMVKDHGEMVKKATQLATDKGMTPPDGPSMLQTTEIIALKALSGGAFDAMYVNRIGVASHEATVKMFEEASQEAQDPDVKAMATKSLPRLREHLEMARTLNEKQDKQ